MNKDELEAWIAANEKAKAAFRLMTPDEKKAELARRRAVGEAAHAADNLDLSPLTNR